MRYYAQYNETGVLLAIGTGAGGVEISEAEYNELLAMIREKADLVNRVYSGEIAIEDVPEEWQEEIARRVEERRAAQEEAEANMPEEEQYAMAAKILMGVAE